MNARRFRLQTIGVLLLLLAACDSQSDGVSLRIHNASATDFVTVAVTFPTEGAAYSGVGAGVTSAYQPFETAYSYAAIEVSTPEETYRLQPFDFFAEPLEPGRYTYVLDIEEGRLLLRFEQD